MSIDGATHISEIEGKYLCQDTPPSDPEDGDMFFDTGSGKLCRYDGTNEIWECHAYTTTSTSTTSTSTTSSSTSTTSSSTSTTSTSTTSTSTTV